MEIRVWRCERCFEQVSGDFEVAANGVAPKGGSLICGKNVAKKREKTTL